MYINFKLKVSHLIVGVVLLSSLLWAGIVLAGDPDSSSDPASTSSYSLEDLYQRLVAGTAGTPNTFSEPGAGPGTGTMHSINEIMGVAPVLDNSTGASSAEVVNGKTFWGLSSGQWGTMTGTATSGSDVNGADGSKTFPIPDGNYSGSKTATANDSNLIATNIVSGTTILGVTGSLVSASGNATDAEVLAGRTYSNNSGASTGTMVNRGAVMLTPTAVSQTIALGYHNGSGYVAGDADLEASKIVSGTTLFGVDGSAVTASGVATDGQVLSGTTYSNNSGASTGTMANNGAGSTIVPTTTDQSVAAGYWSTANTVQGEANLVASKIASGTTLFGVDGSVLEASGNATDGQVLIGQTYSNDSGASTGTMANNGAVVLTPTTVSQTIALGYHNGSGYVAGDADLVATNILSDINIFGVTGTYPLAPVPKTGQTTSYATGDDGDLEKGVAWPNPRFTDNGDGTVTDNLTGLMWMKDANVGNDCEGPDTGTETWASALASAALCNDSGGFAGYTDWRLPNVRELHSLIHYGVTSPAVPNTAGTGKWTAGDPFTGVQSVNYWSSTTYAPFPVFAWGVDLSNGYVSFGNKTSTIYVWPVRSGQ